MRAPCQSACIVTKYRTVILHIEIAACDDGAMMILMMLMMLFVCGIEYMCAVRIEWESYVVVVIGTAAQWLTKHIRTNVRSSNLMNSSVFAHILCSLCCVLHLFQIYQILLRHYARAALFTHHIHMYNTRT